MIAAVASDLGIGKDGKLLFHIKEDMAWFRSHTLHNVVVMGRKTLESFPGGRSLPEPDAHCAQPQETRKYGKCHLGNLGRRGACQDGKTARRGLCHRG